jgi:hypothetical protein
LTRAHSVAVSAEPEKKDAATEGMDTKDAFKAYARANGVQV